MATTDDRVEVREMTQEDGLAMLDKIARQYLGMSGAEFMRRWDAGEFTGDDRYEVTLVSMLLPFTK